jgi:hypothetical protein
MLDQPGFPGWDIKVNSATVRVVGVTKETADSPNGGAEFAQRLVTDIVALGYQLQYLCEIGAVTNPIEEDDVSDIWRGQVNLGLAMKKN